GFHATLPLLTRWTMLRHSTLFRGPREVTALPLTSWGFPLPTVFRPGDAPTPAAPARRPAPGRRTSRTARAGDGPRRPAGTSPGPPSGSRDDLAVWSA